MKRILLADGDTAAFMGALGRNDDGSQRNLDQAILAIRTHIRWLREFCHTDHMEVLLTDPDVNFRCTVYPPYKTNRQGPERPPLINQLKDYLREEQGAFHWPKLEADDVQGIMATAPREDYEEFIVVSGDKDLRQIPGKLFNPSKWALGIQDITPEAAMLWTFTQTLTGDTGDGYPGIPGMGPKTVDKIFAAAFEKGISVFDLWPTVLETFKVKGQTREYALSQLHCARILHYQDYDPVDNQMTLWIPPGDTPPVV